MMDVLWVIVFGGLIVTGISLFDRKNKGPKKFKLSDLPLSSGQWDRFCHLAAAKGVKQTTLLADAVKYYLDQAIR